MATSKNFVVKNGLEVGGQEVIDSSGVVTSAALGGQTLGTTDSPSFASLTLTGYLRGPASFTIDPAAHGDDTGTVVIAGNLQVDGTTTTINSTTMTVDDLNIVLASGAANAAAANGAGITIDGASASLTYSSSLDAFVFNKDVDINGGTIDGVTIGGSSAGAITGTTGQFNTSLNVDGTVTADGLTVDGSSVVATFGNAASNNYAQIKRTTTNVATLTLGASSALAQVTGGPALSLSTGAADGSSETRRMLISSGGDISFYEDTGTTPKFFWDASAESLGIGTTSPDATLDVSRPGNGEIAILQTTANRGFSFQSQSDTALQIASVQGSTNLDLWANTLSFSAGNSERMRIDSSGRVGIGTSSPAYKLEIAASQPWIRLNDTDGTTAYAEILTSSGSLAFSANPLGTGVNSDITFSTDGSEAMRINSGGLVGIGTSSTSSVLTVSEKASTTLATFDSTAARMYFGINNTATSYFDCDTFIFRNSPSSGATERMRIDSSGNVGIGVVPSAWSVLKGFQVGTASTTYDSNDLYFGTNFYYGGAGFNYINSDFACMYAQVDGSHRWSTAASGTAGNPISFSEAMRIDSSGRVGIGTSSPNAKLTSATTSGNTAVSIIDTSPTLTGAETNYLSFFGTDNSALLLTTPLAQIGAVSQNGSFQQGVLVFHTTPFNGSSTERMRIDSSGNVGIGTSSPAAPLHISAAGGNARIQNTSSASYATLSLTDDTGEEAYVWKNGSAQAGYGGARSLQLWNNSNAAITLGTNNAERMRIDSNGLVGIGTSSPAAYLDVNYTSMFRGDAAAGSVVHTTTFRNTRSGTWDIARIEAEAGGQVWAGDLVFKTASSSFANTLVEHMRLDENGNLLVGTTATAAQNSNSFSYDVSVGYFAANHVNGTASGTGYMTFNYNGGLIGSITQNGTTAVLYNTSSDARLKENIADAEDAGAKVDAIQVRQFNWKADGSHQDYGMIAQELMTVAPEAVSGDPESDDMMGVDYSKLVPMMLKEIQSLRARMAQLEGA